MKEIIIDGVTNNCTPNGVVKVEHEFVDLGLPSGRLWATCNIGAEKPTDCGDYFACGAVEPYDINNCDTDSFDDTDVFKLSEMDYEHDAAKVLWGDDWRMPTLIDFAELIDNCTYGWEVIDGITCGVFSSKANNQKIVMPAAGNVCCGLLYNRGGYGDYWSRSFDSSTAAWNINFCPIGRYINSTYRYFGFPVRPVRA